MKSVFLIVITSCLFSCAIVTNRNGESDEHLNLPAPEPQTEVAETPKLPPEKALSRTIVDQDFKSRNEDQELKKRVVVLPILDKKNLRSPELLKHAQEAFMDALNESGELIAVDSSVLKLDLTKFIKNNMYDLRAIGIASNKVGISSLLEPRIIDMRFQNEDPSKVDNSSSLKTRKVVFEVVVQARLFNIHSEQELFNTVKTVTISDANSVVPENLTSDNFFSRNPELAEILIKDALLDFNKKLVDSMKLVTWEGRIAAMQGEKVYLNVGKISGVRVGDILKVVEDSNEIYDPELGYHVGKVQGRVKGTLEIVGFFGQDGAISVLHSGAGFKENDRVEVYQ
jgi:hypothetical protein